MTHLVNLKMCRAQAPAAQAAAGPLPICEDKMILNVFGTSVVHGTLHFLLELKFSK